ncbi:MAG: hypothetical protein GY869_00840 [Planctomycetes bacterium]|nr:hypothetical protein [Planctomycetota bacterium]
MEVGNFKYARHIDLGEQQVSMYLHGGGVITANSIIVKKEKLIVPGILYTEHVYKEDRTDDIDIEKLKEICWAIDDQALTEQEFIEAFKADTEKDDAFQWLAIAAYEESLGYYQDALTSVDIAIDDGNWWPPYEYKAKYIARNEGYDKAVAWFNELITESPNEQKFHYLLGEFYQEQGKRPEAIAAYEKNISMLSDMYEFRFDDNHHLIIDANTNSKHHNDFGDLSWGLEKLASSCYREKDFVKAWQYATMGVSIGRQMLQRKDYMNYTQETVDAGDAYCRIIRAYVYMQQKQWDLAQKEIGKAELLTSKHNSFAWDTLEKAKRDYKNLKSIKYLSKELRRELKVS